MNIVKFDFALDVLDGNVVRPFFFILGYLKLDFGAFSNRVDKLVECCGCHSGLQNIHEMWSK